MNPYYDNINYIIANLQMAIANLKEAKDIEYCSNFKHLIYSANCEIKQALEKIESLQNR